MGCPSPAFCCLGISVFHGQISSLTNWPPIPLPHWLAHLRLALHYGDRPWNALTIGMAVLIILLMLSIGVLLWIDSGQARSAFGFSFLTPTSNASWNPVSGNFHAWPFIYGTLATSLMSLVLAVPISLGVAVFLAELCPSWLRMPLGWLFELLAAIPSVVYGLWGIFVFLPIVVEPVGNFLASTLGEVPVLSILFHGPMPASGSSLLAAALDPQHHDHSHHCGHHPRCISGHSRSPSAKLPWHWVPPAGRRSGRC